MPTAKGTVKCIVDPQLDAEFIIDDFVYKFVGTFDNPVTHFITTQAKLTYDSMAGLKGQKKFEGKLGKEEVTFTIHDSSDGSDSGVTVTGTLITPIIPAVYIRGSASWI